MLTSIVCIMTYYIMQSIAMNEGLMEVPGAAIAMTIFFLGTGIIAVFCIALDVLHQQLSHQAAQKGTRPLLCTGHGAKTHCRHGFVFETLFTAICLWRWGLAPACYSKAFVSWAFCI